MHKSTSPLQNRHRKKEGRRQPVSGRKKGNISNGGSIPGTRCTLTEGNAHVSSRKNTAGQSMSQRNEGSKSVSLARRGEKRAMLSQPQKRETGFWRGSGGGKKGLNNNKVGKGRDRNPNLSLEEGGGKRGGEVHAVYFARERLDKRGVFQGGLWKKNVEKGQATHSVSGKRQGT